MQFLGQPGNSATGHMQSAQKKGSSQHSSKRVRYSLHTICTALSSFFILHSSLFSLSSYPPHFSIILMHASVQATFASNNPSYLLPFRCSAISEVRSRRIRGCRNRPPSHPSELWIATNCSQLQQTAAALPHTGGLAVHICSSHSIQPNSRCFHFNAFTLLVFVFSNFSTFLSFMPSTCTSFIIECE